MESEHRHAHGIQDNFILVTAAVAVAACHRWGMEGAEEIGDFQLNVQGMVLPEHEQVSLGVKTEAWQRHEDARPLHISSMTMAVALRQEQLCRSMVMAGAF